MIHAIVIRGDFDDDDWKALVAIIRAIDERHQDRNYEICAVDPAATAIESAGKIMDALPAAPRRDTAGPVFFRRKLRLH